MSSGNLEGSSFRVPATPGNAEIENTNLLSSDLVLPVVAALKRTSDDMISKIQLESKRIRDEMKEEMKAMLETMENGRAENTSSIRLSVHEQVASGKHSGKNGQRTSCNIDGIDVICQDEKLTITISKWFCDRVNSDLKLFWSNGIISGHNSSLSVALFGIQRKEGLGPYKSSLGVDLGLQAREIVSRLLWSARCTKNLDGMRTYLPTWLYSFVPVCRVLVAGNEQSTRVTASNQTQVESRSSGMSETNTMNGYSDLADSTVAWKKESTYFKDAVMEGCRAVEVRKPRERGRKVARCGEIDAVSQDSLIRRQLQAKSEISAGAQAVRKYYSNFFSQNRCSARECFYDTIGFLLYYIRKHGVETASGKGFRIDISEMTSEENAACNSSTKFNATVEGADVGSNNGIENADRRNRELLDRLMLRFPCLSFTIYYEVVVEDDVDRREHNSLTSNTDRLVPKTISRSEKVNLISLSTIVLTELTRAGTGHGFLRTCNRSLQSVLVVAMAFRALICKTLGKSISAFEDFVLGKVYLVHEDIPSSGVGEATVIAFLQDESNRKRLQKKLRISMKQYMLDKGEGLETLSSAGEVEDDIMENGCDDIFQIPTDEGTD